MNGKTKRFLSLLLAAVMLFGMLPVMGASAATVETIDDGITRIYGANRYETAFGVADATREFTGQDPEFEKFDAVVVAYGREFADALAGSYLAISKNAPILLISNYNREEVKEYIRANLVEGGTVYLLGGTAVVPEDMEQGLDGFQVKRLWGANRLGTNLAILNEVPIGDKDLLVCTGWEYADALSASATGLPIMLVSPRGLTNEQKTFLEGVNGNIIICGGVNAVSDDIEAVLRQYGDVERLAGANRYQTSVLVAERFINEPNGVVLAYGRDFPDGLCGGVLANMLDAPVILTKTGVIDDATAYVQSNGITQGIVLGGSGLISNDDAKAIFAPPPVLGLTVDTMSATVTDIRQSISGTFSVENGTLAGISCTAANSAYPEGAYEIGDIYIDESTGTWMLSDILLFPGENVITFTLSTLEGYDKTASVTVSYDSGSFAEYEASEITYFEDDSGIGFINNVILVVIDEGLTPEDQENAMDQVIEMTAGTVIGQLNSANVYQVEVQTSSFEALEELCLNVSSIYGVEATCDLILEDEKVYMEDVEETQPVIQESLTAIPVYASRAAVVPNDNWNNNPQDWNEDAPAGLNWWLEAVHAPSAWSYAEVMNRITIGIADTGIDKSHEDLSIGGSLNQNVAADHGTHVAGIIGATENNGTGITGLVWNHRIINYDAYRGARSTSEIVEAVNQLIEAGAKVINDSNGTNLASSQVAAQDAWMSRTVNNWADTITDDFIVVQAAGNSAVDSKRAGTFASVSDSRALEHIIIVAATEEYSNGGYMLTNFSNYGSGVTIAAPGRDIYSTVVGGYGRMSGTSMAAPIVTGVASMVWSVNPSLSAAEVKQILVDTATTEVSGYYDGRTYYMVNAEKAVEEAVDYTYSEGTAGGRFVDAATGYGLELNFRVHQDTSNGPVVLEGSTISDGSFQFELPAGDYVIEAYGANMITAYTTFPVHARSHTDMGDIPISTEIDENTYRVVLEWGEYPNDLDSHMVAESRYGGSIHVCYYQKVFEQANLDVDDTSSYGPETITVNGMAYLDGFTYCVHNYTDRYASSGEEDAYRLSQSGAIVKLYRANTLVQTFNVPTNRAGTVWNVFSIDRNGNISVHNSFEFQSDPGNVGMQFISEGDNYNPELQLSQEDNINEDFYGEDKYEEFLNNAYEWAQVPGLEEGMVPQGIAYNEQTDYTYVSAYHAEDASVIMVLDYYGDFVAEYHLKKGNGSNFTGHVGGMAVYDNVLYISNEKEGGKYRITALPLGLLPTGGSCELNLDDFQDYYVPVSPSFLGADDGILWVGNFYYPDEDYDLSTYMNFTVENCDGEDYGCYIVGYNLGSYGVECLETEAGENYATPHYVLAAEQKIQGMAYDYYNDKVFLTKSYGRRNDSELIEYTVYTYNDYDVDLYLPMNGEQVPCFILDSDCENSRTKLIPMAEGVVQRWSGELMVLFESGANKYSDGLHRTDAIWQVYY